jgi:hypothetical protein
MIGPWGWAARLLRDDLLISTAMLLGFRFPDATETWRYLKPTMDWEADRYTKAELAEEWLGDRRIRVTPTLNIEKG